MSENFELTETLPMEDAGREDFYNLIRTAEPLSAIADEATIEVSAKKLAAKLNVPRWVKVGSGILYSALAAAAQTNSVTLFTLPASGVIHGVKIKHSVKFAGPGFLAYRLSVGTAAEEAKYAAPFDVLQAVGDTVFGLSAEVGGGTHDASGTAIKLWAASQGANLNVATAGTVDVWVLYSATE